MAIPDPGLSLDPTIAGIQNEATVARTQASEDSLRVASQDPSKTFVTDMNDLRKNHPEAFRAFQEAIFEQIRRENNRYHKRLIARIKEQRQQ